MANRPESEADKNQSQQMGLDRPSDGEPSSHVLGDSSPAPDLPCTKSCKSSRAVPSDSKPDCQESIDWDAEDSMMPFVEKLIEMYAQIGANDFGCSSADFDAERILGDIQTVNLAAQKECGLDMWNEMQKTGVVQFAKRVERRNEVLKSIKRQPEPKPEPEPEPEETTSTSPSPESTRLVEEAIEKVLAGVRSIFSENVVRATLEQDAIEKISQAVCSEINLNQAAGQARRTQADEGSGSHWPRLFSFSKDSLSQSDQREDPKLVVTNKSMSTSNQASLPLGSEASTASQISPITQIISKIEMMDKTFERTGLPLSKRQLVVQLDEAQRDDITLFHKIVNYATYTSCSFARFFLWLTLASRSSVYVERFIRETGITLVAMTDIDLSQCMQQLPDDAMSIIERILVLRHCEPGRYETIIELSDPERFERLMEDKASIEDLRRLEHDIHVFDIRNLRQQWPVIDEEQQATERNFVDDDPEFEDESDEGFVTTFNPTDESAERRELLNEAIELAKEYPGFLNLEEPPPRPFHNDPMSPMKRQISKSPPPMEAKEGLVWEGLDDEPTPPTTPKKTHPPTQTGVPRAGNIPQQPQDAAYQSPYAQAPHTPNLPYVPYRPQNAAPNRQPPRPYTPYRPANAPAAQGPVPKQDSVPLQGQPRFFADLPPFYSPFDSISRYETPDDVGAGYQNRAGQVRSWSGPRDSLQNHRAKMKRRSKRSETSGVAGVEVESVSSDKPQGADASAWKGEVSVSEPSTDQGKGELRSPRSPKSAVRGKNVILEVEELSDDDEEVMY